MPSSIALRLSTFAVLSLLVLCALALGSKRGNAVFAPQPHGKPTFRQRLVAVGDLHGGELGVFEPKYVLSLIAVIQNTRTVLRMAGVIDSESKWSGGDDILVQTGDIVDRGTYALDIYRLMQSLRGQASASGGKVISILGNHEIMNAIGDWRYVTKPDINRFGSTALRQREMSVDGWLGQEWLAKCVDMDTQGTCD